MDARTKRVSLDFIGEGWKDCFVELRYMKWGDYKRFSEIEEKTQSDEEFFNSLVEKIRHLFVSGQVLEGGKPVSLTSEMIGEFDVDALKALNNIALGYTDPKE